MNFTNDTIFRLTDRTKGQSLINSSKSAYLFSHLDSHGLSLQQIELVLNNVMTKEEVVEFLSLLVEHNAVSIALIPESDDDSPIYFRDYSHYLFDENELKDSSSDLPDNIRKEILFLCHYGKNSNLYRILNISADSSVSTIKKAYQSLSTLLSEARLFNYRLGRLKNSYEESLRLLKQCAILLNPEKRARYDLLEMGKNTNNRKKSVPDNHTSTTHYANALFFLTKNKLEKSLTEIAIALSFEPNNSEYLDFQKELYNQINKEKCSKELEKLHKTDFNYLSDSDIHEKIETLINLSPDKGAIHLDIAEILYKKKCLKYARKLAEKAKDIDNSTSIRADNLISDIDRNVNE